MFKQWFLRRAVKRVMQDKLLSGELKHAALAARVNDDRFIDRALAKVKDEPSFWQNFRTWVLENWPQILSALLGILVILEKEPND